MAQGGRRVPRLRRGAAADSGQPARDGAHEQRPLAAVDYAALAPRTWAGIGYVVVCSTFLSYFMVPIGQRYLRPTVVSMYNYVQPVVAVLFSVAIGLDSFGFTKAAAALCVFAGVWLVTKSKSRAQVEAEAGMKKG